MGEGVGVHEEKIRKPKIPSECNTAQTGNRICALKTDSL